MTTDQQRADALYALADEIELAADDEALSRPAREAILGLAEAYRTAARIYGLRSCKYCHAHPGIEHSLGCVVRNRARSLGRIA